MRLAESAMIVWSTADSAVQRTRRGSGFVIPITRFDSPLQNSLTFSILHQSLCNFPGALRFTEPGRALHFSSATELKASASNGVEQEVPHVWQRWLSSYSVELGLLLISGQDKNQTKPRLHHHSVRYVVFVFCCAVADCLAMGFANHSARRARIRKTGVWSHLHHRSRRDEHCSGADSSDPEPIHSSRRRHLCPSHFSIASGNRVVIPEGILVQGKVDKLGRNGGRGELYLQSMSITYPTATSLPSLDPSFSRAMTATPSKIPAAAASSGPSRCLSGGGFGSIDRPLRRQFATEHHHQHSAARLHRTAAGLFDVERNGAA